MNYKAVQSVMGHVDQAMREIKKLPRSGMSKKSLTEIDLACELLNDCLSQCRMILPKQ